MGAVGTHYICELYDCPSELLNDEHFVSEALREAVNQGSVELIDEVSHHFTPQGVTALGLLAESHISIHTWPEYGYAAVDVFTCGSRANPEGACLHLARVLKAGRHSLVKLTRGSEATDGAVFEPPSPTVVSHAGA